VSSSSHLVQVVRCLLIEPNPESALNEEAGRLLLEDYKTFFQRALMMTSIHAKKSAPVVMSSDVDEASEISSPMKKMAKVQLLAVAPLTFSEREARSRQVEAGKEKELEAFVMFSAVV
jgi:ubiquitin-conjugating enzyme E2 S